MTGSSGDGESRVAALDAPVALENQSGAALQRHILDDLEPALLSLPAEAESLLGERESLLGGYMLNSTSHKMLWMT
jgi:hypothetical protein